MLQLAERKLSVKWVTSVQLGIFGRLEGCGILLLAPYMGIIDECFGVAEGNLQRNFQFLPCTSPVSELWLYNLVKHDSIYHQHSLKYVINVQRKFCKNKSKSSRKDWSERTFLKFCVQRLIAPKVVKSFFWYFQCLIFWHLSTSLSIG